MPMLFGPLALLGYGSMIQNMYGTIVGRRKALRGTSYLFTKTACQWSILSGLLVLSCAPHQEPRFLLPSIVPLVFLYGRKVIGGGELKNGTDSVAIKRKQSKLVLPLLVFWIIFNLILYTFFGWLHQGGLLPSLLHLENSGSILPRNEPAARSPRAFIYYKTYMPPTFLTRGGGSHTIPKEGTCKASGGDYAEETCLDDSQHQTSVILDLQGADSSVLLEVLRKWLPCPQTRDHDRDTGAGKLYRADDRFLQLVSPPSVMLPLLEEQNGPLATVKW
eukprot:CAMPEP_0172332238 /NCGR_PEP_ID=MMETSP1058-20130122/62333_1 /TAXON_ID=83371 /ORGANISM="Detonula confervacea, Strain CCMP 353" /LENGTH=275 /DNA_ID=CAMNT_0013049517 /DNA_START=1256 /DNA_END=2080 /DNA_ORIENTATION=+